MFSAIPNRFKYRQNATFTILVFIFFSAVLNRLKYRQNAPCSVHIFLSAVSKTAKMHNLPSLFSNVSLQFEIAAYRVILDPSLTGTSLMFTIVPDRYMLDVHDRP